MDEQTLQLERVISAGEPAFAELLAIYTQAHPASERKSPSLLASMIQRPEYQFLAAAEAGRIVGFSIVLCFPGSDACLLEYMAVERSQRGRGVGQRLFSMTRSWDALEGRFLIAEVDSDKGTSPDRADRTRRKGFYRRLGCREVAGLNYLMPPVSGAAPPTMDLLVWRAEMPPSIPKLRLRGWLEAIYTQVYSQPATDPRIDFMLQGLPGEVDLI